MDVVHPFGSMPTSCSTAWRPAFPGYRNRYGPDYAGVQPTCGGHRTLPFRKAVTPCRRKISLPLRRHTRREQTMPAMTQGRCDALAGGGQVPFRLFGRQSRGGRFGYATHEQASRHPINRTSLCMRCLEVSVGLGKVSLYHGQVGMAHKALKGNQVDAISEGAQCKSPPEGMRRGCCHSCTFRAPPEDLPQPPI
jgi:hypothetical protein